MNSGLSGNSYKSCNNLGNQDSKSVMSFVFAEGKPIFLQG